MKVHIATVGRHRTVTGIAKSVFDLGNSPEAMDEAVSALQRANPHLRNDENLKPGMNVFVPELRRAHRAVKSAITGQRPEADTLVDTAFERAKLFAQLTGKPLDTAIESAKSRAAEMKSPEVIKAIQTDRPDLANKISAIQDATANRVEQLETVAPSIRAIVNDLIDDLARRRAQSRQQEKNSG